VPTGRSGLDKFAQQHSSRYCPDWMDRVAQTKWPSR
jgi:phage terminase small subunit